MGAFFQLSGQIVCAMQLTGCRVLGNEHNVFFVGVLIVAALKDQCQMGALIIGIAEWKQVKNL